MFISSVTRHRVLVKTAVDVELCCVQDGGLWINLGPLLYHWADSHLYLTGEDMSIEVRRTRVLFSWLGFGTARTVSQDSAHRCQSTTLGSQQIHCDSHHHDLFLPEHVKLLPP